MKQITLLLSFTLMLPVLANVALVNECNQQLDLLVKNYETIEQKYLNDTTSLTNIRTSYLQLNQNINAHFQFSKEYLASVEMTPSSAIPAKLIELDSYNNALFQRVTKISQENTNFLKLVNTAQTELQTQKEIAKNSHIKCDYDGQEFITHFGETIDELDIQLNDFKKLTVKSGIITQNLFAYTKEYLKLELASKHDAETLEKASSLKNAILEILDNKNYELINNLYYGYYHDPDHYNKTRTQKCLYQRSLDLLTQAQFEFKNSGIEIDSKKFPALSSQYETFNKSFKTMEASYLKNWKSTLSCQQKNITKSTKCASEVAQYQALPKSTQEEFLVADKLYTQIYDKCVGGGE